MKRVLTAIVVLGVLGLFGWYLYGRVIKARQEPERRRGRGAVAVEVAEVRRGAIRDVSEFTGTLLPRSQFVVAPKIGGRLETLHVNIGDRVDSGDLIATVDCDESVQEVEQVRAEVKVAQANLLEAKSALDAAEREFKRIAALHEKRIASESELDVARSQREAKQAKHQVALAQVAYREAVLRRALVRLSYTRIHATWQNDEPANRSDRRDGGDRQRVVGERFVDAGAMLRANDPIVSILDLNTVIAVIHIIERDYTEMRIGQEATVATDAYSLEGDLTAGAGGGGNPEPRLGAQAGDVRAGRTAVHRAQPGHPRPGGGADPSRRAAGRLHGRPRGQEGPPRARDRRDHKRRTGRDSLATA